MNSDAIFGGHNVLGENLSGDIKDGFDIVLCLCIFQLQ